MAPKATTIGFAGLSFSNNGGSDWTELSAFSEHAIVNFVAEPSTATVVAPAAPAGMPIVLKGRNFGRDHASFGCSFDGAPAGAMGAGDGGGGSFLSSTLFRCEVPPWGATFAAVLPTGHVPLPGSGGTLRQDASWDPVPGVDVAAPPAHSATSEAGGGTFTLSLRTALGHGTSGGRSSGGRGAVGPGRYRPPRHQTQVESLFLNLSVIL